MTLRKSPKSPFGLFVSGALLDGTFTPDEVLVHAILKTLPMLPVADVTEFLDISESTAWRTMNRLEDKGLLVKRGRGRRPK